MYVYKTSSPSDKKNTNKEEEFCFKDHPIYMHNLPPIRHYESEIWFLK